MSAGHKSRGAKHHQQTGTYAASGEHYQIAPNQTEQSTRNNATNGITGVLFESQGYFLQVLEGQEESIDSLLRSWIQRCKVWKK
jgi:hypothetical protein